MEHNRLSPKGLGLAFGVMWGVGVFFLGMVAWLAGWWVEGIPMIAVWYKGFDASLNGSVVGGLWGFADGFFCGWLIAWLYNKLA